MWRVFNFRAFLLTAICAIVVILSTFLFPDVSGIILSIVIAITLAGGVIFIFAKDAVKSIGFFLSSIVAIIIIVNLFCTTNDWKCEIQAGEEYKIEGKIERIYNDGNGLPRYLLGELTANGKQIKGRMSVRINPDDNFNLIFLSSGDAISFISSEIFFNELIGDQPQANYYRENIRYSTTVSENSLTFLEDRSNFLDALRNSISQTLNDNMGEYGSLAMGMITGDKGTIEDDTIDMYSAVGIGHILAVSGLHIGFLVAIINWLLNKLKASKILRLIVSVVILVFYCSLSFFSASAIRASIMCVIGIVAEIFGERKDMLSTLSFAFTSILCVSPLYLFDVGFLMSITAVFGIILFKDAIEKFFSMFLPKFLAPALAISISAQIGITPITLIVFNTFNTFSILTNLVVIPIVSLSFTLIMLTLIIALILPFMGFLLSISGILLALVDTIANLIAFIPFAKFIIYAPSFFYLAYALLFLISRFFMLPKGKTVVSIVLIVLLVIPIIFANFRTYPDYTVNMIAEYKSVTSVVRVDDGVVIVGDCKQSNKINSLLSKMRERNIKAVLVHSLNEETVEGIVNIHKKYGVTSVYCSKYSSYDALQSLAKSGISFNLIDDRQSVFGFTPVVYEDDYYGYGYGENDISVLFTSYGQNTSKIPVSVINNYSVIRAYVYGGTYTKRIYLTNYENTYLNEMPESQFVIDKNSVGLMLKLGEIINY